MEEIDFQAFFLPSSKWRYDRGDIKYFFTLFTRAHRDAYRLSPTYRPPTPKPLHPLSLHPLQEGAFLTAPKGPVIDYTNRVPSFHLVAVLFFCLVYHVTMTLIKSDFVKLF